MTFTVGFGWVVVMGAVLLGPGWAMAGEEAHPRLRATQVGPLDGWVPGCVTFEWASAPDSPVVRYALHLEQGGVERVIDVGLATRHEACLDDGLLAWKVVAFDAEGRSRRTPAVEVRVDGTPPRVEGGVLSIERRCLPERVLTVGWLRPPDTGSGLAEAPYVLGVRSQFGRFEYGPPSDEPRQSFVGLPDGPYSFQLFVTDRVGNEAMIERLFVSFDCRPPAVADRWSGVVPATATPGAPLETGLVLREGVVAEIEARGALCFTPDRACDPSPEPAPCASPRGPDPGTPAGVAALPHLPFGALLVQVGDAPFVPFSEGFSGVTGGPVRLAINTAEPSPCRRPGYAVNILDPNGETGLIWPVDGEVVAEATPSLTWRLASNPAGHPYHPVIFVDGVGRFEAQGAAQWRVDAALAEGPHTWQIVTADAWDNLSMTPPSTFVVDLSPPEPFEIVEPAVSARVEASPVAVCWAPAHDVGGVDHYRVRADDAHVAVVEHDARDRYCVAVEVALDGADHCVAVEAFDQVGRTTIAERCFAARAPLGAGAAERGVDGGGSVEADAIVDAGIVDGALSPDASAQPDARAADVGVLDSAAPHDERRDAVPDARGGGAAEPAPGAADRGGSDGCATHRGGGFGGLLWVLGLMAAVRQRALSRRRSRG